MISEKTADVAQRATVLYDEKLRRNLEATNLHAFVAIEPDSGDYFLDQTLSEATAGIQESASRSTGIRNASWSSHSRPHWRSEFVKGTVHEFGRALLTVDYARMTVVTE